MLLVAALALTVGCGSPADLHIHVTRSQTLTPASGVVLYSAVSGSLETFATDMQGHVVWSYPFDTSDEFVPAPITLLPNGHMLYLSITGQGITGCAACGTRNFIREIDLAGNTIWQLTESQLQQELTAAGYNITVTQISHDALALPNGHIVVIVSNSRNVTLTGQTATTFVVGSALVDLDQNHRPVWVWDSFDHLDVNRHPYFPLPDWIHGNAVLYSPDDGNLIFSARNLSWLIKIDYQNGAGAGDILWRLGHQGDFTLTGAGPSDWFYGEHGPILLSPNSTGTFQIGMFDNGNSRVLDATGSMCGTPGQPACYSTVPIFEINESNRTARVVWRDTLPFFCPAMGNMQILANGDVWFAAGFLAGRNQAILREVTMTSDPQPVLELDVNQALYRAVHLPSLPSTP